MIGTAVGSCDLFGTAVFHFLDKVLEHLSETFLQSFLLFIDGTTLEAAATKGSLDVEPTLIAEFLARKIGSVDRVDAFGLRLEHFRIEHGFEHALPFHTMLWVEDGCLCLAKICRRVKVSRKAGTRSGSDAYDGIESRRHGIEGGTRVREALEAPPGFKIDPHHPNRRCRHWHWR